MSTNTMMERRKKDEQVRATIHQKLIDTGEKDRLKNLLRAKLEECGWRDELKNYCKEVIKNKGLEKITVEELVAEMRNTSRDITEFVVHWTETFKNQNLTAEDIHEWHIDKGYTGIGYHYIITRDGKLQRGRPLNLIGDHAPEFNHNQFSIGIAFVGGFNCSTNTKF